MNSAKPAGVIRRHPLASVTAVLTAWTLLSLATFGTAFAASPAGTPIGNQATATYKDASATSYTVTSNAVTTIVQQVASFTLTAPGTRRSVRIAGGTPVEIAVPAVVSKRWTLSVRSRIPLATADGRMVSAFGDIPRFITGKASATSCR